VNDHSNVKKNFTICKVSRATHNVNNKSTKTGVKKGQYWCGNQEQQACGPSEFM
jgi:hypothetical protein